MKSKIIENLKKYKNYKKTSSRTGEVYFNEESGWVDYLISDKIIFSYRDNEYSKGTFSEKLHSHDYYELAINLTMSGTEYVTDGNTISFNYGMAILTKPNKFHMIRLSCPLRYKRFIFYFKDIKDLFPDETITKFTNTGSLYFALFSQKSEETISLAKEIKTCLEDDSAYSHAKAKLKICELFLNLSNASITSETVHSPLPQFIHNVKNYVDENYLTISSVEEIAERFFYSREYLSRSFKKYFNTPVYEYVIGRKMLHATELLKKGESVEVALKNSGFHNASSFIKLFRKLNGCTPSEYKAKYSE